MGVPGDAEGELPVDLLFYREDAHLACTASASPKQPTQLAGDTLNLSYDVLLYTIENFMEFSATVPMIFQIHITLAFAGS